MATPNVPGFPTGFDSQGFRQAIHFAMQMGAPPDQERRVRFLKKSTVPVQYFKGGTQLFPPPLGTLRLDRDGNPLDPEVEVVETADEALYPDCAVEVDRADADELPVGNFRPTKLIVTLLDNEYDQVQGCKELVYNGDRYIYGYEPEANGLFDVGVHTMIFYALNES